MNLETLRAAGITLREDVALKEKTTLKIGGPARLFAQVPDAPALSLLLRAALAEGLPVLPLGKGSNVLFDDEGFDGVVCVLSGAFRTFAIEGDLVRSGAGVSLSALAVATRDAGLSGLEGLSGIPSSIGGAIRINAGSYGTEIFELLEEVESVSRSGERRTRSAAVIPHGYRWSALVEEDDVVTAGSLRLRPRAPEEIRRRLDEVAAKRGRALPRQPNAGSIFRNPPGDFAGRLLEECGMKGRRIGGAAVSDVHANVIVNLGGATAADVRALMAEMSAAVKARSKIALVPEVEVLARDGTRRPSVESGE